MLGETGMCKDSKEWKSRFMREVLEGQEDTIVVLIQVSLKTSLEIMHWLYDVEKKTGKLKSMLILMVSLDDDARGRNKVKDADRSSSGNNVAPNLPTHFTLTHSQVGGSINHRWAFRFNQRITPEEEEALEYRSRVVSTLRDFLSETVCGKVCDKPLSSGCGTLSAPTWKSRGGKVKTKCVFSPTGWVERRISMDELMDVYDIRRCDRSFMKVTWGENVDTWPSDFLRQIPARVMIRCLESLILSRNIKSKKRLFVLGPGAEEAKCLKKNKRLCRMQKSASEEVANLEDDLVRAGYKSSSSTVGINIMDAKLLAKNDDAQAPVDEWNKRALKRLGRVYDKDTCGRACDLLRRALLRRFRHFKYGVIRSFRKFMIKKYGEEWMVLLRQEIKRRRGRKEIERDYDVGMDAIHRASNASFWEWDDGSTLFFWRWPSEFHESLRDGMSVWFRKIDLPSYWGRQRWPMEESERIQLKDKIGKVLARRYIASGFVSSLTGFFAVPKGTEDIRVVYDATKSGLNDAIWSPNFFLPTIDSVVNQSTEETFFGDIDVGEMFLNYFLDPRLRAKAGVDVTELAADWNIKLEEGQRWILRWERSLMGVWSSPYNCVRIYLLGEEIIRGDRMSVTNPMRWDKVILNLPGTRSYDPSRPWLYKYDSVNNRLAAFLVSYVDDLRTGSHGNQDDGDEVVHHVAARLNYLGQQDASRKRGFASHKPGAWAGAVVEADVNAGLYVTITQQKWDKVKSIIERYVILINSNENAAEDVMIIRKLLEQDVGFLVHVFMTFENLRPFLKGFYLTLNGWRFDRNEEGWKLGKSDWEDMAIDLLGDDDQWEFIKHEAKEKQSGVLSTDGPPMVKMMNRMKRDLEVLKSMFASSTPSRRLVRGKAIARILYGFGDASGAGFGASWSKPFQTGSHITTMRYRFGRWGEDEEGSSSNYRELKNLVDTLDEMVRSDELTGVEVFFIY
jgi:hypothetical protein